MMQMIMQTNSPKNPNFSFNFIYPSLFLQIYLAYKFMNRNLKNMYIFVRFNFPMSIEVTQIKYSEGGKSCL